MPRASVLLLPLSLLVAACGSSPETREDSPARSSDAGVGIVIGMEREGTAYSMPTVALLALTGPAAQVGVARHDTIWAIEGQDTTGLARTAIEAQLVGPVGSTVRLRVGRSRSAARDVTVTRAPLPENALRCEVGDCQGGTGESVDMWGERYEGEFQGGRYHGKGKLVRPDGQVHEGRFAEGVLHGSGSIEHPNGERYVGTFDKGLPRDIKIILANGDFYEGATSGFEMHGAGRLQRPDNGDVWEGRFDHNKLVEGTWLHHPPGDARACVRTIANAILARSGTITYPPGDPKRRATYEGELDDACRAHGKGVMRYSDKKKGFAGTYQADEPQSDVKPVE